MSRYRNPWVRVSSVGRSSDWYGHTAALAVSVSGLAALYVVQTRNFLLFHSIVEIFSILVAFGVFIITWNAREELEHPFIVVLGISYLFVGGLDLLHTLAYRGMGVFPNASANLPTQLWLLGRSLEAASVLGAGVAGVVVSERDRLNIEWNGRNLGMLITGFAVVVALGLGSIFVVDWFPRAYVLGSGLTRFKVVSEYVIVGLFGVGLAVVTRQQETFDERVFRLLAASLLLTMLSELAFTFYVDVYGLSNAAGHFLKLGSFYLIYLGVVKTGIKNPQRALYRTLAQREAEARKFKKAADHSGHAILITDRDGMIQYANTAWEDMTGYDASEAIGRTPRLLKSGEHDDAFYEELWETILAGDIWEGEIVNERKNGERFVIYQTTAPILTEDGKIAGFVAIHDDITEQKAYEERLESDLHTSIEQLQVLARILRHNIRNELNVVSGTAETVRTKTDDADIEAMVTRIEEASDRLLMQADKQREIVQLLLEPSTETPLQLDEVVDDVVERLTAQYPHAEVTVDVPPELELTTIPELRQAITEIVENAIIHTDRETPTVTISARSRDEVVEISVTDDGPEIPAVERQVIAEETEIDALLHSSGMGLWLASRTVRRAGGTIRFEDADQRGNVVTLVVP
ncbi:PAS domain S-box protein [Haloplanus aerogenes]|uniref:histidine kinase n=1 Tax=Haloplanus aerogenes TaxID=660522 RepID=A0A3M0CSV1_9EURY|nr:PAS domain S-box protein [Haloplanus aerogenes]RMB12578.1 PAS domain S-box-containing protein [Haloplanus aerogenes]